MTIMAVMPILGETYQKIFSILKGPMTSGILYHWLYVPYKVYSNVDPMLNMAFLILMPYINKIL